MCALKPAKAWAEQKNSISRIICMTPQRYEILKNLAMKSASCLPLHSSGKRDEGVEALLPPRLPSEVCFGWWREVRFPRCFTEACTCPDISHLCTPRQLACLQPSVLMHYRSSRHHRSRLAKADTLFSIPWLIFIQGCLSHTTTLEGCDATSV